MICLFVCLFVCLFFPNDMLLTNALGILSLTGYKGDPASQCGPPGPKGEPGSPGYQGIAPDFSYFKKENLI
jgi:hypothetical protein